MSGFVCVVDSAFFNHKLYKEGDRLDVEDPELIARMNGRFVSEDEYDNSLRRVVVNIDRRQEQFSKAQIEDITKEVASENARLKAELKEMRKKGAVKKEG